jgi:hypothetical protein
MDGAERQKTLLFLGKPLAIDIFSQVIALDPKNTQAYYWRACAYNQEIYHEPHKPLVRPHEQKREFHTNIREVRGFLLPILLV